MLECYSQRIRCFVEGLAFEGADMIPWRPGLLDTGAVRRDEKPFAGKQLLNPPDPRPAAYRVDPRKRPRKCTMIDIDLAAFGQGGHVACEDRAVGGPAHIAGHHAGGMADHRKRCIIPDRQRSEEQTAEPHSLMRTSYAV